MTKIKSINDWKSFKLNENAGNTQSIENGTEVTFHLYDNSAEDFAFGADDEEGEVEMVNQHDGQKAIVDSLETFSELGNKSFEYYNITFGDGYQMIGVSGQNLAIADANHNENIQFDVNNFRNLSKLAQANEIADILNKKYTDYEFHADGNDVIVNSNITFIKLTEINNYVANLTGTMNVQVHAEGWKNKANESIQFDVNNFRNLSKIEQAAEIADMLNKKYVEFEFNSDGNNVVLNGDINPIKLKEINNYITNLIGTNSIQVTTESLTNETIVKWKNYKKVNENSDHPAFKNKPYAMYEPLAKKIMDLVSETKPTHTTEEMLKACKAHDDKFEEYDERGEVDKWTAELPYLNETDADTQAFIKLVKTTFEELKSLTDEQISDLVYGTYAEYWFGHGYPYTNELVSLASRLYKALNTTKEITNENAPGTADKFTDEELVKIATVLGVEAVQIDEQSGLPVFGGGEFTLLKHSDGVIEMLRYDDVTSEFKEFKSYNDLGILLEDLKDNKFQTNESEATDHKHTYMMLGRLSTDNDYFLGHGNRSPKCLWAGDVDAQIAEMKRLWETLPQDGKPEWLSMEDILDFETKMKQSTNENSTEDEGDVSDDMNFPFGPLSSAEIDFMFEEYGEILNLLEITETNLLTDLYYFGEEECGDNQILTDKFYKFIKMIKALYTPIFTKDMEVVYDFNGTKVWIEDKFANCGIYINKNGLEKFNSGLDKLLGGGDDDYLTIRTDLRPNY